MKKINSNEGDRLERGRPFEKISSLFRIANRYLEGVEWITYNEVVEMMGNSRNRQRNNSNPEEQNRYMNAGDQKGEFHEWDELKHEIQNKKRKINVDTLR